MAIKISQSMKQQQSLLMTPQLQQAIKLLTLTHMEMTNVIASEMVENPMLEEAGAEYESNGEDNSDPQNKEALAENFSEQSDMKKDDDFDWQSYVDIYNTSSSSPPTMSKQDLDELPNYENMVSSSITLQEHLEWQLRMEELDAESLDFALTIIHNLNDDGYLASPFQDILSESDLDRDVAEDLLGMVRSLDPVGCACDNLSDCLLVQARHAEERSPLLEKIIREHLHDLEGKNYPKIAKEIGVDIDKVKEVSLLLQNFHPKPGRLVSTPETHYVVPDIFVINAAGEFVVHLNDEGVPRLKISKLYQSMLADKSNSGEAKEYVQDKLRSALWLIKSIQNRQKTIHKVAESIVKQQQDFFKKGPKHLKPMILKNIAEEIGMHESTVSRVTTNKYMHTPIGVFELKYFFTSSIGGKDGGADISSEVLKLKIKELVDNESPHRPLSDQKIVELLTKEDVAVARRTVAKYREMLGILSSSKRKVKA